MLKRTTILADSELLLDARHLAKREGKTFTALVQVALREYIEAHRTPRELPDWAGIVSDDRPWSVEEQNRALREGLDNVVGSSPARCELAEEVRSEQEVGAAG